MSGGLVYRIAYINNSVYSDAASSQSSRVMTVAESRGMIYDRNMNPMVNNTSHTLTAVNPTAEAKEILKKNLSAEDYKKIEQQLTKNKPFYAVCDSYTGDCEDIIKTEIYDRYSENNNAAHIIGYTDSDGNGVSGIEKAFDSLMKEYSGTLSIRYTATADESVLGSNNFKLSDDNYNSAGGLVLTIDSRMQRICEDAMKRNGIEKGAVVVLDAQTSEILALASAPTFDVNNLQSSLNDENLPFLNRAVNAYSVGSVFKPIVSAAALEKNIPTDTIFDCAGFASVNGIRFNCHKKTGHGKNDMIAATAESCNVYFIELGKLVGAESIILKASQMGFGKETALCDTIISSGGNLPTADEIDSAPALANLSFGQGSLLATPLQIAAAYCVFTNGGYYKEPYILKSIVNENGTEVQYYKSEVNNKVLTESICKEIRTMLKETVESGSGKLAKPMANDAAGKTATAETGRYIDGEKAVHTWFAGYYPAKDPKYVIVVFKENGSTSSTDCAPVFRDIADAF